MSPKIPSVLVLWEAMMGRVAGCARGSSRLMEAGAKRVGSAGGVPIWAGGFLDYSPTMKTASETP